jgi:hypothetical protein
LELSPPDEAGSRCNTSAIEDRPVRAIALSSMVTTGEGWSSGSRRMRDPVTTMSSAGASVAAGAVGVCGSVASCAAATCADSASAAIIARLDDRIIHVVARIAHSPCLAAFAASREEYAGLLRRGHIVRFGRNRYGNISVMMLPSGNTTPEIVHGYRAVRAAAAL